MLKEAVTNIGIDIAAWRAKHGEHSLTPTGERNYKIFINRLKQRLPTNLSEHMGILDGYDYISGVKGLEKLYELNPDKKCLILTNHERDLPIRGGSLIFPIGYHVKKATEEEIRWVYGTDISLDQFGKDAYEKSLNFILVGGKNLIGRKKTQTKGVRELLNAIGEDVVGLYPEGDNGNILRRGQREAGGIMALAAKRGGDIICSTTWLEGRIFKVIFQKLDNDRVMELWSQREDTDESPEHAKLTRNQNVVDYAMNTIALPLPQEKRGYYQNPEHALGVDL